jgi:quercetin dioxygenase-like cupin family protein
MVMEHRRELDGSDPSSLVLDLHDYALFNEDAATVVLAPKGPVNSMVVWNLEPGQENDYHQHPETEHLQFVIQGELEWTLGDAEPVTVRPGQVVVVPPGVPHGIQNKSSQRASYVSVNSPGSYEKILVDRPQR